MNQGRKTCWVMEVQQMGSGSFQDMLVLWEWCKEHLQLG